MPMQNPDKEGIDNLDSGTVQVRSARKLSLASLEGTPEEDP